MDAERVNKWATFCFFVPSSIVLAYFVFYLSTFTPTENPSQPNSSHHLADLSAPSIVSDNVVLLKGQPKSLDKVQLTYLGIVTDAVVIDVTILELDPDYAYRRIIPTHIAKQGFYIAQQHYRVISAGNSKLKILRTRS